MGRCPRIKMILQEQDPFFDNYSNEIFACHGMIDLLRVSPDNIVTVTLNKELLNRMLISHIHTIRKIPYAD